MMNAISDEHTLIVELFRFPQWQMNITGTV